MVGSSCPVIGIRYLAVGVANFDEVLDFYTRLWGMECVANDGEVAYLGSPVRDDAFLLRLRKVEEKRLDLIALAVKSRADVDNIAKQMADAGIRIDRAPGELSSPGGGYGMRFFDCDGRLVELSADVAPRLPAGTETKGVPLEISHIVLNSTNVPKTHAFYEEYLGFRISDWLEEMMVFLRCGTPQHHILAVSQGPHVSLSHIAYEVGSLDAQMRGTGRLMRAGMKPIWGPGRHGAGDNTFSYFIDPAGNICEYTTEMEQVEDDSWTVRRFTMDKNEQEQWGTGGLATDMMVPAQFNDVDNGLWKSVPV